VSGSVVVKGKDITHVPIEERSIGIVFQSYALFPTMTVYDNIAFGLKLKKLKKPEVDRRVREIARKVDLSDEQLAKAVSQLSGGQQQRVSIARALAGDPSLILADEPTGNLDSKSTRAVIRSFEQAKQALEATIFMVTHDSYAASFCDRVVILRDGVVWKVLEKGATERETFQDQLLDAIREMGRVE